MERGGTHPHLRGGSVSSSLGSSLSMVTGCGLYWPHLASWVTVIIIFITVRSRHVCSVWTPGTNWWPMMSGGTGKVSWAPAAHSQPSADQGPVTGPVHSCLVTARVTRWATASLSHLWPLILASRRSQIVPCLNSEYLKWCIRYTKYAYYVDKTRWNTANSTRSNSTNHLWLCLWA